MGSREKNTDHIYTRMLGEKLPGAVWFDAPDELVDRQTNERKEENFAQIVDYLAAHAQAGDLVITLGCGDVYKLAKEFAQKLSD